MIELENMISMSHYAGNRWDLVQAGGGNASVKIKDEMYIKASGFLLAEIDVDNGVSHLSLNKLGQLFSDTSILNNLDKKQREAVASKHVKDAVLDNSIFRPSIETLLHSLLGKYVLHTHSVIANFFLVQKKWEKSLNELFPDAYYVSYATPGIDLALKLKNELSETVDLAKTCVIFLQNHGIIVSSNSHQEVIDKTEEISIQLEKLIHVDFSHFRFSNIIHRYLKNFDQKNFCVFYSELITLKYSSVNVCLTPVSPDVFVFCGYEIVQIEKDLNPIRNYISTYQQVPNVILHSGSFYLIANTIKKAKEVEELLNFQLMITSNLNDSKIDFVALDKNELYYLGNWESEKYRQKI